MCEQLSDSFAKCRRVADVDSRSRVEAIQAESFAPPESVNLASPWTPSSELMDLSYLNVGEGLDTTQGLQKPIPVPVPTPLIIGAIGLVAVRLRAEGARSLLGIEPGELTGTSARRIATGR